MYNVHCQWHPLKKCIVGRTYDSSFFENIPSADKIARICEETETDLRSLIDILEHFDVEVLRPRLNDDDRFEHYDRSQVPRPPIAPRDALVVIGNTMFEFGFDHRGIRDCIEQDVRTSLFAPYRTVKTLPAPSITQLGKDLLVDSRCFTHWEIQWIRKQLPDYRINEISIGDHNDSSFIILKPGVAISLDKTIDWEVFFPGWHILTIDDDRDNHCREWLIERKINQGKWWIPGQEDDTELSSFVDQWLNHWTGHAAETVFSINALIIDERHVVINTSRKDVIEFLKSNEIEAIVCPQRHQYFWDNGIHCMTLDLYREGEMFDLFPSRKYPFSCSGY